MKAPLGQENGVGAKQGLKVLAERIAIKWLKIDTVGKTEVLQRVLENKRATRTDGIPAAVDS